MGYTDEQLKEAVVGARSISDVLRKLGLAIYGGGCRPHLFARLKAVGIDPDTIRNRSWNKGLSFKPRMLEKYLVRNGPLITSSRLRKRLFKAGLKTERCEICGLGPEWNSKPLKLQLDHIDGDHYNNELVNLRILCPNCHTQTDSYAVQTSARTKTTREISIRAKHTRTVLSPVCTKCGVIIKAGKTGLCNKCYIDSQPRKVVNRPNKSELETLVAEIGYSATGRLFGVSDNCVRKWLKSNY